MLKKYHPFHIVEVRPWPLLASLGAFCLTRGMIIWIHNKRQMISIIAVLLVRTVALSWWKNIFSETRTQGAHTKQVTLGLQIGMLLFITSEVLFFFSFFWAFFHSSISPNIELGQNWPPTQIIPFNPINIPLLNTLLLLSSGVSVTWCHHAILKDKLSSKERLIITVFLGLTFSRLQAFEYIEAPFSIADSVYGTTFFVSTGFHGTHVLIGTLFLIVRLSRVKNRKTRRYHLTNFECAAWYWHFVDVVWLFLYINVYWWGR